MTASSGKPDNRSSIVKPKRQFVQTLSRLIKERGPALNNLPKPVARLLLEKDDRIQHLHHASSVKPLPPGFPDQGAIVGVNIFHLAHEVGMAQISRRFPALRIE